MILPLLLFALGASAAPQWHDDLSSALVEARASGRPVLIDFQAPWCYSCYFMEKHVLDGAAFAKAAEKLVLLKVDVDKGEGYALRGRFRARALPTYVLLSPKEETLGRIVGEQTEADFLRQLEGLLSTAPGDPLEQALALLKKRLAAGEYEPAAKDLARMPETTRAALAGRPDWKLLTARLELMRGLAKGDAKGLEALKTTLSLDDSCEAAYDVSRSTTVLLGLPAPAQRPTLELERAALEKLADARLFVPAERRCADFRTGIEELCDVYERLGEDAPRKRLLERTVSFLDAQGVTPGEDRNFDDNKRNFLEMLEDDKRLSEFYSVLIAAYPSDYVYPYRRARYLQEHDRASEALPLIEKADRLAYGANRLKVTEVRAKVLAALGRKAQAKELLARDAKAARKTFPAEAAGLAKLAAKL